MSLNVKRLPIMTPRALTDFFSDLSEVFASNFNLMSSVGLVDSTITWIFLGFAFIPVLPNQSTAIHQLLNKSVTNVTLNCHQRNLEGNFSMNTNKSLMNILNN